MIQNLSIAAALAATSMASSSHHDAMPVGDYLMSEKVVNKLDQNARDYTVVKAYKRTDPSFIQGLLWDTERGQLLESTGQYGESVTQWLVIDENKDEISPTGAKDYDKTDFGEGISALPDGRWIELTWRERKVRFLDHNSLEELSTMAMWDDVKAGWGITLDAEKEILYVSDGSEKITRVDANTLQELSQMTVYQTNGTPVPLINELEFVGGYIWANVFYQDAMVKICPCNGMILDVLNFEPLRMAEMAMVKDLGQLSGYDHNNNVCNGIAYDAREDVYFVTGKRWNTMFKIKLSQQSNKDDLKCQC